MQSKKTNTSALKLVPNTREGENEEAPENFLVSERVDMRLSEPEMIFPGLWPARTIALFTGDGGIGKTHLTLQLLLLLASGGKIDGTPFQASTPRPVVYISQEDEGDFLLGELLNQHPQLKGQSDVTSRIRIVSTALQGPNLFLNNEDSRRYIEENLSEGSVFVLDSWSTFLTSNENDNSQLLQNEIRYLKDISKARKSTPLLIHHRSKANAISGVQSSSRGATALPNSCRFHIMLENKGAGVRLTFEKISRGAKPDHPLDLLFDEERKLFVPKELDRCVAIFQPGEELSTTQFIERLGKDAKDEKERKKALDILRQRSKNGGPIKKVAEAKKGQDAIWGSKSESEEVSM